MVRLALPRRQGLCCQDSLPAKVQLEELGKCAIETGLPHLQLRDGTVCGTQPALELLLKLRKLRLGMRAVAICSILQQRQSASFRRSP